jgi:hypothetical protein
MQECTLMHTRILTYMNTFLATCALILVKSNVTSKVDSNGIYTYIYMCVCVYVYVSMRFDTNLMVRVHVSVDVPICVHVCAPHKHACQREWHFPALCTRRSALT